MSLGGSQTTTTTTQQPAWLQNAMQSNISRAQNIANRDYPLYEGPRIADFTQDQQNAFSLVRGSVGQSTDSFNEARDFLRQSAQGVSPERIQAAQMQAPQLAAAMGYQGGVSDRAQIGPASQMGAASMGRTQIGPAQGMDAASMDRTQIGPAQGYSSAQMNAPQLANAMGFDAAQANRTDIGDGTGFDAVASDRTMLGQAQGFDAANARAGQGQAATGASQMGAYDNPYQRQVIDRTFGDLDRAEDRQLSQARRRAAGASAFGGSRSAILEGEIMRGFDDRRADVAADLRARGFDTALQASQADAGRLSDMSRFNAGQRTQMADANANRQQAAAQYAADMGNQFTMRQGDMDAARAEANAGRAQSTAAANADIANRFDLQQGQMDASRTEANAGRNQQAAQFAAQMGNNFALQQGDMDMRAALDNAGRADQASQFGANAQNAFAQSQAQIDAQRAQQNAAFQQDANRFGANAQNAFTQSQAQMDAERARQNAAFSQDASRFNAGADNAFAQSQFQSDANRNEANAGRQDAAARFAAQMGNNFALQQGQMDMNAARANMDSSNMANQFNASQGLQAALANQQAAFNAGQGLSSIENMDRAATNQDIDRLNQIGEMERQLRQQGMNTAYQDFINQRDWDLRGLNAMLQATGNVPAGMFGSTSQKAPSNVLGEVGSLLGGIGSLIPSDRRLKQDIIPLGGGVYEYAYIWDPTTRHVGVMADEVPARFRIRGMSGFDLVDYGLMALEAA